MDSTFGDANLDEEFKTSEEPANVSVSAGPANGYIGPSGGSGAGLGSYLKVSDVNYKSKTSLKKGAKGYSLSAGFEQMNGKLSKTKHSGWWTK